LSGSPPGSVRHSACREPRISSDRTSREADTGCWGRGHRRCGRFDRRRGGQADREQPGGSGGAELPRRRVQGRHDPEGGHHRGRRSRVGPPSRTGNSSSCGTGLTSTGSRRRRTGLRRLPASSTLLRCLG
jgi:hypothetical protein